MSDLRDIFYGIVEPTIDEEGCPNICLYLDRDNRLLVDSLSGFDYRQILRHVIQRRLQGVLELIFGIDRTTSAGQGTEFSDVYTCAYWKSKDKQGGLSDGGDWEIGVINYLGGDPKIVREWDWNNEFWKQQMGDEVRNSDAQWDALGAALIGQKAITEKNPEEGRPEIAADDLIVWTNKFEKTFPNVDEKAKPYFREIVLMNEWLGSELGKLTDDEVLISQQQAVAGTRAAVSGVWAAGKKVFEDFKSGVIDSAAEVQEKIFAEGIQSGEIRVEGDKILFGDTTFTIGNL